MTAKDALLKNGDTHDIHLAAGAGAIAGTRTVGEPSPAPHPEPPRESVGNKSFPMQVMRNAFESKDGLTSQQLHEQNQRKRELRRKKRNTRRNKDKDVDVDEGATATATATTKDTKGDAEVDDSSDFLTIALQGQEVHKNLGDYVKSIIYGGLDGIVSTFAIIAGVMGADLSAELVLVLGFSNLVADAISMGMGDYLSENAEIQYITSEYEREQWEFDNFMEGEIQEMIEVYTGKGIAEADANKILRTMSKYPELFVNHMMRQELELTNLTGDEHPLKGGVVTFISFILFGCIPLLSYAISEMFQGVEGEHGFDPDFMISIILTLLTLFVLGVVKGKLTETNKFYSGCFIMANGAVAAGAAYVIGYALKEAVGTGID